MSKSFKVSFPFPEINTDTQKYMLIHSVASYSVLSKAVTISADVKSKCGVKYSAVPT